MDWLGITGFVGGLGAAVVAVWVAYSKSALERKIAEAKTEVEVSATESKVKREQQQDALEQLGKVCDRLHEELQEYRKENVELREKHIDCEVRTARLEEKASQLERLAGDQQKAQLAVLVGLGKKLDEQTAILVSQATDQSAWIEAHKKKEEKKP